MSHDHYQEAIIDAAGNLIGFEKKEMLPLNDFLTKYFLPKAHIAEVMKKLLAKEDTADEECLCGECKRCGYVQCLTDLAHRLNIEI